MGRQPVYGVLHFQDGPQRTHGSLRSKPGGDIYQGKRGHQGMSPRTSTDFEDRGRQNKVL